MRRDRAARCPTLDGASLGVYRPGAGAFTPH